MKSFVNVKARRIERFNIFKSLFFVIIISAVLIAGIGDTPYQGSSCKDCSPVLCDRGNLSAGCSVHGRTL